MREGDRLDLVWVGDFSRGVSMLGVCESEALVPASAWTGIRHSRRSHLLSVFLCALYALLRGFEIF